jgi:hypothetical protein
VPQLPLRTGRNRARFIASPIRPYLLRIVAASLLAATAAGWLLSQGAPTPQARARVGLTTAVQWPFYDVVREQLATRVESPEFALKVSGETNAKGLAFTSTAPEQQAFVDITATASTRNQAVDAANSAAALLVADSRDRRTRENVDALKPLESRLIEVNESIRTIDATISALVEVDARLNAARAVAAPTPAAARELAETEAKLETARSSRGAATSERAELQSRIDRIKLDSRSAVPEVEVLRPAVVATTGRSLVVPGAIAAGLLGLGLGALLATLWDRDRGRLRTTRQFTASGLTSLGILDVEPMHAVDDPASRAAALDLFDRAAAARAMSIGVVATDAHDSIATVNALARTLLAAGYDIAEVHAEHHSTPVSLLDISSDIESLTDPPHIVVAWPIDEVRFADARDVLELLGERVDLTLVDCGAASGEAWRPRARSCDAVLLVGRFDETRVNDLVAIDHRLDGTCAHLGAMLITGRNDAPLPPPRPRHLHNPSGTAPASPVRDLVHAKNR